MTDDGELLDGNLAFYSRKSHHEKEEVKKKKKDNAREDKKESSELRGTRWGWEQTCAVGHIDPPLPILKSLSARRPPRRTGEVPIPQEEAGTGSPLRPRCRGPRGQEQRTERGGQLREN